MTTNVIKFPNMSVLPPQNDEELQQKFLENKMAFADFLVDHYMTQLFNSFAGHGFDVGAEEYLNNLQYLAEVMRMTLYNNLNIEHPLNEGTPAIIELLRVYNQEEKPEPIE